MAKEEKKPKTKAAPPKSGTSIKKCSCSSAFQDKHYGHGLRLHNNFKSGARCTICGNEKLS